MQQTNRSAFCRPAAVLAKIGIDQTVMAPIGTAAFFAALNLMEGKPDQIVPSLQVCIMYSSYILLL